MPSLIEQLRSYRKKIADEQQLSYYMVFNNKTIEHLAAFQPQTSEELLGINGFGPKKLEIYGEDVLNIIRTYQQNFPAQAKQEKAAILQQIESSTPQKTPKKENAQHSLFCGALAVFNMFDDSPEPIEITYDTAAKYNDISQLYFLESIAGSGSVLTKCITLMNYLCAHVMHNELYSTHSAPNLADLLDNAWDAEKKDGLSSLYLAYILRSFYQSQNIKARMVFLSSFSPFEQNAHVVVEAWLPEQNKWVMFDPTNNTYIANSEGVLLNLAEIRIALSLREKIFFAPQTAHNQKTLSSEKLSELETYFAQNIFFLRMAEYQTRERNPYGRTILIAPTGFNYEHYLQTKKQRQRNIIRKTLNFLTQP